MMIRMTCRFEPKVERRCVPVQIATFQPRDKRNEEIVCS
jgi:hypothetical protein